MLSKVIITNPVRKDGKFNSNVPMYTKEFLISPSLEILEERYGLQFSMDGENFLIVKLPSGWFLEVGEDDIYNIIASTDGGEKIVGYYKPAYKGITADEVVTPWLQIWDN